MNLILIKQLSVIGVRAGEYGRLDPVKGQKTVTVYTPWQKPAKWALISSCVALAQAVEAMRLLENREVIGKAGHHERLFPG